MVVPRYFRKSRRSSAGEIRSGIASEAFHRGKSQASDCFATRRINRPLRVIGAIRSQASIEVDLMSLDHSIECFPIYIKNACGGLLVAPRVREYARDVTTFDGRQASPFLRLG